MRDVTEAFRVLWLALYAVLIIFMFIALLAIIVVVGLFLLFSLAGMLLWQRTYKKNTL